MANSNLNGTDDKAPVPNRQRIGPGERVLLDGVTYEIVSWGHDASGGITVLLDDGDRLQRRGLAEMALTLMMQAPQKSTATDDFSSALVEELDADEQQRYRTLEGHLLQIITGSRTGNPEQDERDGLTDSRYDWRRTTRPQRVRAKARELRLRREKPCSVPSLYRLLNLYENGGGIDALIHGARRTINDRLEGLDPRVLGSVRAFLTEHKSEAKIANENLLAIVRADLRHHGLPENEITMYRLRQIVGEASRGQGLHHEAAGRSRHAGKPVVVYGNLTVSRPGEVVQIDANDANISLWSAECGWAPAAILTAADVYTRCVVALRVVTGAVTSREVTALIADMGRPRVLRTGWPRQLSYWHGIPQIISIVTESEVSPILGEKPAVRPTTIVLDRGPENNSQHLISAAARVGIDVVFAPPRAGHAKGIIESLFNGFDRIQSLLAAYKGASAINHPSRIELDAVLTPRDLADALWEYILGTYHHRVHKGLTRDLCSDVPLTPAGVYQTYLENGGWLTAPTDPYQFVKLMSSTTRLLQDYGITIDKNIYNSADLLALRPYVQRGLGKPAIPLTCFYDRYDITQIYLRHPANGRWISVPIVDRSRGTQAPYSEVVSQHLRETVLAGKHRALTANEIHLAQTAVAEKWRTGEFVDRREARRAALEQDRRFVHAIDLANESEEFRALCSPSYDKPLDHGVEVASSEDDEPFEYEEDFLDFTDIEIEESYL
ncbi:Mu transposase C-terminal domain-containing protein [Nocardioides sp. GXZ039]|uniref:Mu transposase C-terminal domain-containing protein n=1 Tax=Nocardioides sp. GXZ039 TaxID=3136018 RepID=UPI0030F3D43B